MKKKVSLLCVLSLIVQLLVPFAMMTASAEGGTEMEKYIVPDSPAVTYNMNVDWKFKKASDSATYPLASAAESVKKDGKNFYDVDYDDSDWETVSVPHPINAIDSFDGNCYDAGEGGLYRGFMFYRKHITVPETDAGKKLFLEFEAVRQSVYLYVNGEIVGYYEAGITAMGFDITDYVNVGEDNVIAVATDNASDRGQSDTTKVTHETKPGSVAGAADGIGYQWNTKDFNEVQGGITGNVNLYAKGSIYQTLPLYNNLKTTGNYIYATDFDIRAKTATITVEGEIRNESDAAKDITLEVNVVEMVDPNKDSTDPNADHTKQPYLVQTFSSNATTVNAATDKNEKIMSVIPADAYDKAPEATNADTVDVTKITASAVTENLKFWSPDSPNLYDVYTVLKDGDTVIDVQKTTTGFRKVEYDITDGGLKINDTPVWLTGYAQRSTNEWAVIGVANDWLQDLDMQWIKESNSNFIRWMHVAPKPVQIRSGDKYGVVSAAPAGDKEGDTDGRAWDQRVEAMRDTMIYFRNSPSVLFWEAGNNAITAEHQQEMTDLKTLLDPNGGRFAGCRTLSSQEQVQAADYVGTMLNRHASTAKASMAAISKYVPIMETEYAREEAPRRVWDDFSPPDYDYRNKWLGTGASKQDGYDVHDLTSEDFAVVDARAYNEFYSDRVGGSSGNDYYSAAAIMVWSDSNMHNRNTASENCRTSGKVDAVRIKKEAFYAMQAAQSTTPKIHILGHWNYPELSDDTYNYPLKTHNGTYWEETGEYGKRDPKNKTVYVIGSAGIAKMELYVNDTLVGTSTKPDSTFVYSFPNIDVTQSGTVKAVAYDAREQVIAEDDISTVGEAVTLKLTPVAGPDGLIADGSDIAYFDVAVVDKDGNTCPLAYDKINLSVSGEGVLLGGYNSGVDDKITTNKDYCYAECGTNRVFVRSTRKAGDIVLSASLEGQAPVTSTIKSTDDLEMKDGLTTKMQRAFAQGEIAQTVVQSVDPLKTLASVFTADFDEQTGNTEVAKETEKPVDIYTMKVNGVSVDTYKSKPQFASNTESIVCDAIKTLDALKAAGADITYTIQTEGELPGEATIYDGTLPIVSVTGGLKSGYTQLDIMNGSTTLIINKSDKNLLNAQIEYTDDEMVVDIAAVLGYINGVTYQLDTETKTANITYNDPNSCVEITATYDDNGMLTDVKLKKVNISEVAPVFEKNRKVMYWDSLSGMKPLSASTASAVSLLSNDEAEIFASYNPQDVTPYDTLVKLHECESSALTELTGNNAGNNAMVPATIEDGAPDGTKYIKTGAVGNNKYNEYCFESECAFAGNTKADVMLAADIRFDAEYAGITPEDTGDKKVAGAIVLKGGTIQIQSASNSYTNTNISVDTSAWYHIALVGRYSASDANVDMYVWKYNEDGTKTFIQKVASTPLRNLSASNNNGVSHLNVLPNTSVDNIALYMLGADTLAIDSGDSAIKAGETMLFTYSATRANEYITAPAVTWSVYNEANDALLNDSEISVSDGGLLTIGGNAESKVINVRVTANAGTDKEIYASKKINVSAVDTSSDSYDALTITADKTTVRAGSDVKITAVATKNGAEVTPADGDLKYLICNEANLRELGNKNITITDDGVLSVTQDALAQKITVRGTNKSGSVVATCQIEVLPSNMNTGNEDIYTDTFASANVCEEYGIAGLSLKEGSWDGSGYYDVTAAYDFVGFPSDTTADVIYSADMRFANDGAGWTIFNNSKGKLGLQLSSSGTTLNAVGASNKVVGSLTIDKSAWYNVQIMCSTGNSNAYAVCSVYKYDENGKRVNPQTGAEGTPYLLTVSLRNLAESTANHININAGTEVDNVLNMYVAPDNLKISVDAKEVLAGGTAQASATASRKGIDFPYLNSNLIKYEIYDAENKYPLGDDKISIDSSGKISVDAMANPQDVYVRVLSTSGGLSDSVKLTVKSSDIFEITKAGFDEEYTVLKRLKVTKNFYYDNDVTFIVVTYDENGAVTSIGTKKLYGDTLALGDENYVQMNISLPADFDKTTDTMKVYTVTKVSANDIIEPDGDLTAAKTADGVKLTKVPAYDAGSDAAVLVIKADADMTDVKESDILGFDIAAGGVSADYELKWAQSYTGGCIVLTAGKVSGVHKVHTANVD